LKKIISVVLILTFTAYLLTACSDNDREFLIYDKNLTGQELVDSIVQAIPDSFYVDMNIVVDGEATTMLMIKHSNILKTESLLSEGISVVSVYDYNANTAYQYFTGDNLTEEERTYGMELSLTDEEIGNGIDYQLQSLEGIGDVLEAYITEYNGEKVIFIRSSYKYEGSVLVFEIYMSTRYSYPLCLSSYVDGVESVRMDIIEIDDDYMPEESFPGIPDYIIFTNYDDYEEPAE
jgi:hypothetical protein